MAVHETDAFVLRVQEFQGQGAFHMSQGQYPQAEKLLLEALALCWDLGEGGAMLAAGVSNELGVLYKATGRIDEAEPCYWHALEIFERILGPDHPQIASIYHNLAGLEHSRRNWPEAERLGRRSVAIRERSLGPGHIEVAADKAALAAVLVDAGKPAEATRLLNEVLAVFEAEVCSGDHEAEAVHRHCLSLVDEDHPLHLACLHRLARLHEVSGA
ncbi:tetratricopeptide repeat protein [Actinomadura barringtoniae]|uniref:Tetratricopeptide repeat protein n=1 Tax=Actinomadura barringtoniae TaxID=1427535 RepID=A0A939P719_9ACTN|nr:tetratricopeptide repeat protein [Actinomadura barringtoniae]MBO2446801.1 tetratricopeptide repeat protein [Actinomadura barringtoniae]